MVYPVGIRSLVAVQYEPTSVWYPALIIAEGRDLNKTFYRIVWAEMPLNKCCAKAVINRDCNEYYFLHPTPAAAV
eukprot:2283178-Ditylum_brightwellii.AAC.1